MLECEYCKSLLSNNSSLKLHQTTAKFCLQIQNSLNSEVQKTSHKCDLCDKEFALKYSYQRHKKNCEIKKKEESNNKEFSKIISDLEQKLTKCEKELDISIETKHRKLEELKNHYEKVIKQEKDKYLKLEKEMITTQTELKIRNEQINELKQKMDQMNKDHMLEVTRLTERLTARTINNNVVNNTYNGIDFSQARFDKHIEDNYTFTLYEKGKEGAKMLIISFLYFNETITAVVSDQSRDKIKITDDLGNHKYVTFGTLFNLCKQSKILVEYLQKYAIDFYNRPEDPYFPLCEQVKERSLMFKEKSFKIVFSNVKEVINSKNENRLVEEQ